MFLINKKEKKTFKRAATSHDVNEHPGAQTYMNIPQEIWRTAAVAIQIKWLALKVEHLRAAARLKAQLTTSEHAFELKKKKK